MDDLEIHEPEHDHLLDSGDLEDDEYEDELEVPDVLCERNDDHGPATNDIGGHYLCDDCAEE